MAAAPTTPPASPARQFPPTLPAVCDWVVVDMRPVIVVAPE